MSRESVEAKFKSQLGELGRTTLNALFPTDFEAYFIRMVLQWTFFHGLYYQMK